MSTLSTLYTLAFVCASSLSTWAQGVTPPIVYRPGFLTLDSDQRCAYLDTLRDDSRQTVPTLLGFTPDYVLGFDGCGQVYAAPRLPRTPVGKPIFAVKHCTGPLLDPQTNVVVADPQTVVLLHQTDGYFAHPRV